MVRSRRSWGRLWAWMALCAVLLLTVMPLWMVVKTALLPAGALFEQAANWWPKAPTLDHFRRVLGLVEPQQALAMGGSGAELDIARALLNSIAFTAIVVFSQTLSAAMAAFALARLHFRGRDLVFGLFVASMMVPGVVTFIPNFVLMRELGLLNTMVGMVAPFCLMQGASVFLLRQFFLSLPRDLEDAARVDGASTLVIFWRIALPLSRPALGACAMLCAIGMWNEFFWPYLVASDESLQVLPVALQAFKTQTPQGQPDWTGLMAAATIALLPTLLMVAALGRQVVDSVQFSGGR